MDTPLQVLEKYFGYTAFRGKQEAIIQALLAGKNTLAILPTGGGKSICFQIPALCVPGVCVVVSPLIALMRDQVMQLRRKGIGAAALVSGMSRQEVSAILARAVHEEIKFLYLSPERIQQDLVQEYLQQIPINFLAIDEAHCISQWGYDFRRAYKKIPTLYQFTGNVTTIALTASATPQVQADIIESLSLDSVQVFQQDFLRPNISYSVFCVPSKMSKLQSILEKMAGTVLVYCNSRRKCMEVAEELVRVGFSASFYHAGLPAEERTKRQHDWLTNTVKIMVCTSAFGMGIDKPDVRLVIHYDMPECVENYYQEAGRAGRDGGKAYAVLLYHSTEQKTWDALPSMKFPPIPVIRDIYGFLCGYLRLDYNMGEHTYFPFEINTFIEACNVDKYLVTQVLQTLEVEGYIALEPNIFLPSKIRVWAQRSEIRELEIQNPALDKTLKAILRTYEGVYGTLVGIVEKKIAKLTLQTEEVVVQHLKKLHQLDVLTYVPAVQSPQLYWNHATVPQNDLFIHPANYAMRKQLFEQRLQAMLQYLTTTQCRSAYMADYFGNTTTQNCGICDNCLKQKVQQLTPAIIKQYTQDIEHVLQQKQMPPATLKQHLAGISTHQFSALLQLLQSQDKLGVTLAGEVFWIN
ncbi:MAG: RecQ family ATP-dependent DNA helicase [Bacteroidetes bacterium]|nr:MAG: RecQ family ATP-dependent DNA helicase [Bacteroidota bacterium]TAF93733.1 MAG: RecQ family ATP-dependent DNA helicase [Bacteroidota bacterium]